MSARHSWSRLAVAILALATLSLAGLYGCGGSDETPLSPRDENPFRALTVGTDTTLDIATWNLHGFSTGAEAVTLVAQAIDAMDLDVVALQEIAQASRFNQLLQQMPGWAGFRAPSGGDWSLAYLWRTATVSVADGAIYEIFPDDGTPFPRAPLILEGVFDGRSFMMVDNHLKCCGDGDLVPNDRSDEEYRRYLAGEMLEGWIADEADGRAVIVVGDLNDRLNDPPADNVFQMFLDRADLYRFTDWAIAIDPTHAEWSWGPGESHLDHILVTDELFPAIGPCRTMRLDFALPAGTYETKISDHLPVTLVLDVDALTPTVR